MDTVVCFTKNASFRTLDVLKMFRPSRILGMKILLYLCLAMSLTVAKFSNEEKKTWQKITDDGEGNNEGVEYEKGEEAFVVEPTKHPYKVRD